ncbi:MAG: S8 family serine peptidase [Lutimonas sp.]
MKTNRFLLILASIAILSSCSSTKNIHKKAVPEGSTAAVNVPAKKGTLTEDELNAWPHADIYKDSLPGMSIDRAYEFVADKKGTTVIVGVIDSGIDINHEDLKDLVWTNSDEVAGNGKDDDKNGYVDDVHGWNFLGGEGVSTPEQLEVTRLYKKLTEKYGDKSESEIAAEDMEEFAYYQKVKKDFEKRIAEANKNYDYYQKAKAFLVDADADAKDKLGKEEYTLADLNSLDQADRNPLLMQIYGSGATMAMIDEEFDRALKYYGSQVNTMYNLDFNGRMTDDNANDINDVPYGNGFVSGGLGDELHGTHVAGISLAKRNNGKGMNGVTNNVKLLAVRAVPDGDEYDKDVALAIRYAVDNGAKVINMSFGKSYSPDAEWVYDAIKYAASKDVLLVHAAGNDHKDIDKSDNFPTDAPDKVKEIADNVITIGAMTRNYNEDLVASFSNYGKLNVDLFAPGLEIYSTIPSDEYKILQGTSMAAPAVAGVAAMVRSYYPELSASQVKHILMNSGIKVDKEVKLPGSEDKMVPFSELSVSGRVVNAYNALKMADAMVNGK